MRYLNQLKKQGYRLTKPREALLQVLLPYPLTAQEIFTILKKKKIHIDLASVYRSLDLFVHLGVVREIDLGGNTKHYELVDATNHHHHLICNNCGTIADIQLNEQVFLKEVKNKSTFKIDHHHLEFFGLCATCQ